MTAKRICVDLFVDSISPLPREIGQVEELLRHTFITNKENDEVHNIKIHNDAIAHSLTEVRTTCIKESTKY